MTAETAKPPAAGLRAIDAPVALARAARIIRTALARQGLNLADLATPEARERPRLTT